MERFYHPSFEVYGGVGGFYDLTPLGCVLKNNLLDYWRSHYVRRDKMMEIDTPTLTPQQVFEASGHLEKFADYAVKDKEGKFYRADTYLEQFLTKMLEDIERDKKELEKDITTVWNCELEELSKLYEKYQVTCPEGGPLTTPEPLHMMFKTHVGQTNREMYLRPETAQGIFVNFRQLLNFNKNKMPFAVAQIGTSYRNEIAPRNGLIRVREFLQAEIEHFVNPSNKTHHKFDDIKNLELDLYSAMDQMDLIQSNRMTLGDAVESGVINNETLAYYLGRTHIFLLGIGIPRDKFRFRQHLPNEMAHYAIDCWDAEIKLSFGWVEVAGHADRGVHDLTQHSEKGNADMTVYEEYPEGKTKLEVNIKPNGKKIKEVYPDQASNIIQMILQLDNDQKMNIYKKLENNEYYSLPVGETNVFISADMLKIKSKVLKGETYIPGVIEPSFGIGRLIHSILETNCWVREGSEQRKVLSLPIQLAPIQCTIFPLSNNKKLCKKVAEIEEQLDEYGVRNESDTSGVSIGRKYSRYDEIGVPFAITIDFQTLEDNTVTLRDRDTTKQIRGSIKEIVKQVIKFANGHLEWL